MTKLKCNNIIRWKITGAYDKIETLKTIVLEPRTGNDAFQGAMDDFYHAITESSKHGQVRSCVDNIQGIINFH